MIKNLHVFPLIKNLESLMTTYMICNLIGLSSTCTNPILYGYRNKNTLEVVMKSVSDMGDRLGGCVDVIQVSHNEVDMLESNKILRICKLSICLKFLQV